MADGFALARQMRSRASTAKVEEPGDLENFAELDASQREAVKQAIDQFTEDYAAKQAGKGKKQPTTPKKAAPKKAAPATSSQTTLSSRGTLKPPAAAPTQTAPSQPAARGPYSGSGSGHDNSFAAFQQLCRDIEGHPSHTDKQRILRNFISQGTSGTGFTGDLYLVIQLLLPQHPKRVYNMKEKQMVKILAALLGARYSHS